MFNYKLDFKVNGKTNISVPPMDLSPAMLLRGVDSPVTSDTRLPRYTWNTFVELRLYVHMIKVQQNLIYRWNNPKAGMQN